MKFFSTAVMPLTILNEQGIECGPATGFFYKNEKLEVFLITNWHVVTTINSTKAIIPCKLKFLLHEKLEKEGFFSPDRIIEITININSPDGNAPTWLEHTIFRHNVDIVAIPINIKEITESCIFQILNDYKSFEDRYEPLPMDDVFVVGYPYGLSAGGDALPLYKKGSVASEPEMNIGSLPKLLIDCKTSEAMSGSPVINRRIEPWHPTGEFSGESTLGPVTKFLGVYSGRLYIKELSNSDKVSDIGVVWKKSALDEIVNSGISGTTRSNIIDLKKDDAFPYKI